MLRNFSIRKAFAGTKDVVGLALQAATIPGSFVAPEASPLAQEGVLNATNVAGKGIDAVSQTAGKVKQLVAPAQDVKLRMTKEAIKQVLGSKADTDVLDEASNRIGKTKLFSTIENELKLTKPQLDDELRTLTSQLDDLLTKSPAKVIATTRPMK